MELPGGKDLDCETRQNLYFKSDHLLYPSALSKTHRISLSTQENPQKASTHQSTHTHQQCAAIHSTSLAENARFEK